MARRRVIRAAAACCALVFAGAAVGGDYWWGKHALTKAQQKLIAGAVISQLKDPDSAKFKWVELDIEPADEPDLRYYCGFINAKNSYGGYVGFRLFLVLIKNPDSKPLAILAGIDDGTGTTGTANTCSMHGYSLIPPT